MSSGGYESSFRVRRGGIGAKSHSYYQLLKVIRIRQSGAQSNTLSEIPDYANDRVQH